MTKQEIIMLEKYCENEKMQGYIAETDFYKLGYNNALDTVIYFLKDLKKESEN